MLLKIAVAVLALGVLAAAHPVIPCSHWPLLKQCEQPWANEMLGTSTTETICDAGCAMTSTTMSLLHFNTTLGGKPVNPGTLNKWLRDNGGYVDTDLLVWNAVAKLGTMKLDTIVNGISPAEIAKYIHRCQPVIMHVRDNTHFVLAIGYDSADGSTIYVNDPGFNDQTYDLSGVSEVVIYEKA